MEGSLWVEQSEENNNNSNFLQLFSEGMLQQCYEQAVSLGMILILEILDD